MTLPAEAPRETPLGTPAPAPEAARPAARREALAAGALIALAHLLLGPAQTYALGARGDDAAYVALGEAIATGQGYRSLWYVGHPVQVKFPPVMPLIFAVVHWLGGSAAMVPALMRVVNPFVCGATVAILWHVGRRHLRLSRLTAAAFVASPYLLDSVLQHFSLAVSEPYFMLAWAIILALYYGATDAATREERPAKALALAAGCGAMAAVAYLTRSMGIGLLPALVLALLLARAGWRAIVAATTGGLVPILAWGAIHARMVARGPLSPISDERSYVSWSLVESWSELARLAAVTAFENFVMYLRVFAGYVSGNLVVGIVVVAALVTFAVGGAARVGRRHAALVLLPLSVAGVVLLFPWFDPRYLTVVLPFVGLVIAFRTDLELAERTSRGRAVASAVIVLAGLLVASRQVSLRRQTAEAMRRGTVPTTLIPGYEIARTSAYLNAVDAWIVRNAPPDARLLISWPAGVYTATRRLTQNADPGEPSYGPSVFDVPGRFVAQRILGDSITLVVTGNPRSGTTRDVAHLRRACPGVLERIDPGAEDALPAYYAVHRASDDCLRATIGGH